MLVVDDEPSIRLLCRVNLELDGFTVLEADSLPGARAVLAEHDVDVVLLDLHVGIESGSSLIDELHARVPATAVVLVTGSAESAEVADADVDATLPKPFAVDALRATVQRLTRTSG